MNIQKLQALITSIDLGSFSRAAERLGYTQSGLTHMMNSLEAELGFPLIERGYFGVRPTPEGKRLLPKLRRMVALEEELSTEVRRIREGEDTKLRIGAYSSIATHWLPSILQSLRHDFPNITAEITQGSVSELYEGIASGRFDLILAGRNDRYACRFIPLREDHLRAILPIGYPVDTARPFPIEAFEQERFLMPSLGFDADIMAVFAKAGVSPPVVSTFVDDPAIISMVEHGLGLSILSELCIRGHSDGVLCLPIEPDAVRELGIALAPEKKPSEAVRLFITCTKRFTDGFKMEE